MGIDKLTRAANAAGFAMVNAEDYFAPSPRPDTAPASTWKSAAPAHEPPAPAASLASGVREWWYALGGRAPA